MWSAKKSIIRIFGPSGGCRVTAAIMDAGQWHLGALTRGSGFTGLSPLATQAVPVIDMNGTVVKRWDGFNNTPAAARGRSAIRRPRPAPTTTRGTRRWPGAYRAGRRAFAPPRRLSVNRGFG